MGTSFFWSFIKWQGSISETLTNVISPWHFFFLPIQTVRLCGQYFATHTAVDMHTAVQVVHCISSMVLPELCSVMALKRDLTTKENGPASGIFAFKSLGLRGTK